MKKIKLILLTSAILLTACGKNDASSSNSVGDSSLPTSSLSYSNGNEEASSSISSISSASSSEKESSASTVSSTSNSSSSSKTNYATWPKDTIQNLCKKLSPRCTSEIPSYDWATGIEIDTSSMEDDLYFGIYCYVDSKESEQLYINKLKQNNWKTSDTKIEGFYESYSPDGFIWLNFLYDSDYKDLEIYVSEAPITSWPEDLINDNLNNLVKDTKTTIPSFEAELYTVNYYANYYTLAINGYGVDKNILETYKTKITTLGWEVKKGSLEGEYDAVSPAKDITITFYYEEDRNEFNIDVQKYEKETSIWPKEDIAALVEKLNLTGEIMEYKGTYSKVSLDTKFYPPAVMVYVEKGKQKSSADEYNKMLLDNGYEMIGKMYGEEIYSYPGTTLAYHATYLTGDCFTIEIFNRSEIK